MIYYSNTSLATFWLEPQTKKALFSGGQVVQGENGAFTIFTKFY